MRPPCAWAVEHFAPDAHTAIIWRLTRWRRCCVGARVCGVPSRDARAAGVRAAGGHRRRDRVAARARAAAGARREPAARDAGGARRARHRALLPPSRGVGHARVSQAGRAAVPALLRRPGRGAGGVHHGRATASTTTWRRRRRSGCGRCCSGRAATSRSSRAPRKRRRTRKCGTWRSCARRWRRCSERAGSRSKVARNGAQIRTLRSHARYNDLAGREFHRSGELT